MARKVVGVGSVGTRCWIMLMLGRDDDDPLFLQVKEAEESVLSHFVGRQQVRQPGPARRRRAAADAGGQRHLPRLAADRGRAGRRQRDFYVRQLRDWKFSVDVEAMVPARHADSTAQLCGWTLARAHARSGDRIAIAAYLGAVGRIRPGHRRSSPPPTPTRTSATTSAASTRSRHGQIAAEPDVCGRLGRLANQACLRRDRLVVAIGSGLPALTDADPGRHLRPASRAAVPPQAAPRREWPPDQIAEAASSCRT